MKIIRISALWCTSCIVTYNAWKNIKNRYNNVEFIELDYDLDDIEEYDVKNILPVIIITKNDKEVKRIIGEKSEEEIIKEIEGII